MRRTVYRSRADWWVWLLAVLFFVAQIVVSIGRMDWISFAGYIVGVDAVFLVALFGVWYAVEGDGLTVYRFCLPKRFSIKNIKEIKNVNSILASPALSTNRLSIKFVDHSVPQDSVCLEISPKDRERFINHLLQINPKIKLIS